MPPKIGDKLVRVSGEHTPPILRVIAVDGERIVCNSTIGGPRFTSDWSLAELQASYVAADDAP